MPSPGYFRQFGFVTVPGALSADLCAALRDATAHATAGRGAVWHPHEGHQLTASKRRTEFIGLAPSLQDEVRSVLERLQPELAEQFDVTLSGLQPLKFARYDTGDGYGLHCDVSHHPGTPADVRDRKVSIVLFLNDQVDEPEDGCYSGGRLTFHGLLDEPPWNITGHALDAEAGLMVAFRPDVLHEVTPVTSGSRYTVVTWFV